MKTASERGKTPQQNPYRLFSIKLIAFLGLLFLLDQVIGLTLRHYYFKQESGMLYRTTYSLEKTTADMLIFGSSRANHHYDPSVLEKRTGLSYYNVGRDGCNILYHYCMLKSVLARYTPKTIILDINSAEFRKSEDNYDRLSCLLPYYKTHPELRPIIERKSRFEKMKLVSSIYPFNSMMFTIAVGNAEFNKKRRGDIQGYVPLSRTWNGDIGFYDNRKGYETDSVLINVYESFISDTKKSGARLFIICSPLFVISNQPDQSINIGKEIAARNGIPFIDFTGDSAYTTKRHLFSDLLHLNANGASVFSNDLIDKISATDSSYSVKKIQ